MSSINVPKSGSPEIPYQRDRVKEIFRASQTSTKLHGKFSDEMKMLRDTAECEEQFREDFIWSLKHVMIVYERTPNVERVIDFAVMFAVTAEDDARAQNSKPQDGNVSISEENQPATSEFLNYVFNFLLDSYEANDKAVRFRVCQLINKLLNHMGDDATIDDDIADRIYDCMLVRIRDKFPIVRRHAVAALARLQDPQDSECPVILSYLQIMQTDNNADVRRAALLNVALSAQTLPYIIERTRDVTESVRKLAYRILAEKVNIMVFTIAQRLKLLQNGLCDTSEEVKKCAKGLLDAWLKSLDGQVSKLLNCLHIETSGKTSEVALDAIFKELPKENLREHINALRGDTESCGPVSISYNDLSCENALFWTYLAQHVKKRGVNCEELLDELIPELSVFCKYIRGYVDTKLKSNWESDEEEQQMVFILRQLLILAGVFDLADEVGRKELCDLIRSLLVSEFVPLSLVNVLIDRYTDVESDEDSRIQKLVEIIADIRQPIIAEETPQMLEEKRKREIKMAGIRVKLNEYREKMQESVEGQEFSKAAELKQLISNLEQERDELLEEEERISSSTIREERDDPWTLERCLTISCEMLQGIRKPGMSATLRTLAETLFLASGIQNEDPQVRNLAVLCLGLSALQSIEFAKQFLVLFLQVAQVDLELVRVTALKVIFDLLLRFGLEAFMVDPIPEPESEDGMDETDDEEATNKSDASESEEGLGNSNEVDPVESSVSKSVRQVLSFLTSLLDSESIDLRDVAAEGMAKLLLSGRVMSAKLLSSLVLLWFSPTTEDDCHLRHCLGVFLPTFACASRVNQELVEEAFLPTLKTLFNAPEESPLASVNISDVAVLFVELCNSNNLETAAQKSSINSGVSNIHVSLAMKIANEILSNVYCPYTKILCRALTLLDLRGCELPNVQDLKVLLSQLLKNVDDNVALRSLGKFQCTLELLDTSSPTGETSSTAASNESDNNKEGSNSAEENASNGTETDRESVEAVNNENSARNEQETATESVNEEKELTTTEETDRQPLTEKDSNTPSMPAPSKIPNTRTRASKRQGKSSRAQTTNSTVDSPASRTRSRGNNNAKDTRNSPIAMNLDMDSCESGDEVFVSC